MNVEESTKISAFTELTSIPTELNPIADFLANYRVFNFMIKDSKTIAARYCASKKISASSSMELARIKLL
jgi:hypothetical protein